MLADMIGRVLVCSALAAALGGCASTQVGAQWVDPAFRGQSLVGVRLLVACEATDPAIQRICQDELAAKLVAFGASPVQAPEGGDGTQLLSAARLAGAKAVFSASVAPDATIVNPGPTFSIGLGGFGGSGYRSGVGGGIGVT